MAYMRWKAVEYAHKWAYSRNPRFLNYDDFGGDCTNFISQCIYAGGARMNYTPTFGWYYIDGNNKAPAWTGVEFLYNFLTKNKGAGPYGVKANLYDIEPGDIIQLSFDGTNFGHSLFVVQVGQPEPEKVLIATHTRDSDNRPLASYDFQAYRCIHIIGSR
jgi:hypothetical protein